MCTTRERKLQSKIKDSCSQKFKRFKMRKRSIIKLYRSKKQKSKGKYEEVD
jgi:hypothetical protein